jgi:thiosulfate/3-mercaptopyruvate sulfurtransferase
MNRVVAGFWYSVVGAWLLVVAGFANAQSDVLVTPAWLEARLDDPTVRIIDLGKTSEDYAAAHIPGAQYVDWRRDLVDPSAAEYFGVADRDSIAALLSRLGITRDMTIVLYDSQSSRIAARMLWVLRYYGHDDIRILDGGARAWAAAGGVERGGAEPVEATQYRIDTVRDELIANLGFVRQSLARDDAAIVDARAPEFYTGESIGSQFGSDTPNAKSGHVPGAKNFFWADHFNDDGTFKSVDELRAQYAAADITAEKSVVTYCHIGLQGSTPWFVLSELLGYPDVRLYDRSMAEWANASNTTTEVVDE